MKQLNENLAEEIQNSTGRKIFGDFLTDELKKPELLPMFDRLTEMYFDVNGIVNISALRTVDDVYIKHYLDSLYPYSEFEGTVCDVGCGGGFPSLPLAIATDLKITGLDSVGKKLMLIHRAVSELHLKNIKADYARSEDLVKLGRKYDTVCARALADTDKSLTFCAPLINIGGKIILYRTQNDTEPKAETLEKLYIHRIKTTDYVLPQTDIKRRLMVFGK